MNTKQRIFTILFALLYTAVGVVSTFHAIAFFSIANASWLAVTLACAFEIGQACVLFSMLTTRTTRDALPWVLMSLLTIVQVIGNIFASYKYMVTNAHEEITYFTQSILFFVATPDERLNTVMISYIVGAILPIVALMMTAMLVRTIDHHDDDNDASHDENITQHSTNEHRDVIIDEKQSTKQTTRKFA